MHQFTNLSKDGPKGINTATGTIYVEPGAKSPPLEVEKGELAFLKRQDHWKVEAASEKDEPEGVKGPEDGSVENDTSSREGGPVGGHGLMANNGHPAEVARTAPGADAPTKPFDAMTDAELRTFLTDRDGRAPHPNTGRAKLLESANTPPEAV